MTSSTLKATPIRLAAAIAIGTAALIGCSSDNNGSAAANIAVISGDTQTGTVAGSLNTPLVVKVTDKDGKPVQGAVVTFTASGGATLLTTTATTDASGLATDSLTILGNTSGSGTVTASVTGASSSATFHFTANPGPAAAVVTISGNNQTSGAGSSLTVPLVAEAHDQFGNPVAGATIVWTTSAGLLTGTTTSVTDASGRSQMLLQLPAVIGPVTVTASLNGSAATQTTFTETATGGNVASNVAVVSGNTQTGTVAGALVTPLVVKVTDANGLPVQGVIVTFTATGGATLRTATVTTDAAGMASDSLMALGTTAGAGTVTASVSGVATGAVFNFTANAGAAAALSIVSGNNQTAPQGTGVVAPLVVKVVDQFGNVVTNATVNWTTSAGSLPGGATSTTSGTGLASTTVMLPGVAGPITVTATLAGTAQLVTFTETAM